MKIGIFSDNHEGGLEDKLATMLKEANVEAIIGLGDYTQGIHRPASELIKVLEPFCGVGVPFFCLPGNYETISQFREVREELTDPNFKFVDKNSVISFNGINLVLIPGDKIYDCFRVFGMDSFYEEIKEEDFPRAAIFSHEPALQDFEGTDWGIYAVNPLTGEEIFGADTKEYIDRGWTKKFRHVGRLELRKLIDQTGINFAFSGHIHESMNTLTKEGVEVREGEYCSSMFFNPGPARKGIYAIVDFEFIDGKLQCKYERRMLFGKTFYEGIKKVY
jgi:predicted phosphodiesterase